MEHGSIVSGPDLEVMYLSQAELAASESIFRSSGFARD